MLLKKLLSKCPDVSKVVLISAIEFYNLGDHMSKINYLVQAGILFNN